MDNNKFEKLLMTVQKPGRYSGGEMGSIVKDKNKVDVRFAFCFPDNYEIGMSHLGMKILYSQFNQREDIWCERVFAPWPDFEQVMRDNDISLFGLESRDSIGDFDFIGFTLQYEMSYTNILNMLNLANVPIKSCDRESLYPIVVAGGPCACNPEPLADFIDIFFLGEGEEVDLEVIDLYKKFKAEGRSKKEFLRAAADIEGVYVPSLYSVEYNPDGTISKVITEDGAPEVVKKRIIADLDKVFYPDNFVVPFIEIVHDRVVQEIFRGCIRGCRFCQAGFIYRPVREKSPEVINKQAKALCDNTGYDEISISSLSTSDYTGLEKMLNNMLEWTKPAHIGLSLPSLRIDNFSKELLEKTNYVRKSGLTFAPEAGTQRLRDVINKNITEEEIFRTCKTAFEGGYSSVKLYFMLGLPTETDEDIKGIADLGKKIVDLYYNLKDKPKGKPISVSISVATFVPKPFTPFEFEPQITKEEMIRRQQYLRSCNTSKKVSISWHDSSTSLLEGALARGDRRIGKVLEYAFKNGCKFDTWNEYFKPSVWEQAFNNTGLDPEFYANRTRSFEEINPWDRFDYGVTKKFLVSQNKLAHAGITTPNCREKCAGCGAACFNEGICNEKS